MNKISQALLKLVLWPSAIYRRWGIDTRKLALILQAKLTMDDRRPNTFQQTRAGQKKEGISNAMLGTMFMAMVMGAVNLVVFALGKDNITHFSFFFLGFMFLLASILITDFTSVLIDVRDNMIILSRPVNDRTILMAKLLHIIVHLSRVILPMSIPVIVYMAVQLGWWAAVSIFILITIASLYSIFLVNAVYLLVLKIMSPEKFKSFIAWFQVGFVVFLYGGYQVFLRLSDRSDFQAFSLADNIPARFFPPYWFARAWTTMNGEGGTYGWLWILLILFASLACIWLVIRFLAPAFNRKLSMIQGSGGQEFVDPLVSNPYYRPGKKRDTAGFLANFFTRDAAGRAGFIFAWRWTSRNRGFRMRVYPTIGYVVIWFVLMIMNSNGEKQGTSYSLLLLIYLCSFILISSLQQMSVSDDHRAAWIFYSSPIKNPGAVIKGSFMSLVCKYYLPLAMILSVAGIAWKGPGIIPNLLLGLSNQMVTCSIIFLLGTKAFPASRPLEIKDRSANFLKSMMILLITGAIAVVHFLVFKFIAVVVILIVLSVLANWLLQKKIGEISWKEIRELTLQ